MINCKRDTYVETCFIKMFFTFEYLIQAGTPEKWEISVEGYLSGGRGSLGLEFQLNIVKSKD